MKVRLATLLLRSDPVEAEAMLRQVRAANPDERSARRLLAAAEVLDACDGFLHREAIAASLPGGGARPAVVGALPEEGLEPGSARFFREKIALDPVDARISVELIDDAYNANPASLNAAIEWLAQQPWSNGNIGMWGCSATGGSQMQAATTAPPHPRSSSATRWRASSA